MSDGTRECPDGSFVIRACDKSAMLHIVEGLAASGYSVYLCPEVFGGFTITALIEEKEEDEFLWENVP